MKAHFMQNIFLFLLVHNSEFLEYRIKNYCIRPHFDVDDFDIGLHTNDVRAHT